jgi:hypothetical protein
LDETSCQMLNPSKWSSNWQEYNNQSTDDKLEQENNELKAKVLN